MRTQANGDDCNDLCGVGATEKLTEAQTLALVRQLAKHSTRDLARLLRGVIEEHADAEVAANVKDEYKLIYEGLRLGFNEFYDLVEWSGMETARARHLLKLLADAGCVYCEEQSSQRGPGKLLYFPLSKWEAEMEA
jgi:hypothetical protein